MKTLLALTILLISTGCTPLVSTVIQNGCGADKVDIRNKGESDMKPTTSTEAAIPVSVGAQPNATGTVGR